ncbi:sugar transferase [Cytobacillus sp. Sa5YUA1]|uniref:Sugar transferase n=1 Tax=Cytobacillus stercorigallinarum TaxID=2762240 RepID=A0ABR8QSW5_9BACI|nr:sugar transferase [Cytobacillus stercorigallinarum]MBD7938630.1 sugar transferase [Cytobacillus stercorigallinarum]
MYRHFFKRLLDLIITLIAFPFWLLMFIIFAPMIYLEDKGSIFYTAHRLGRNGENYKMYKFRSMKMNAPDIRNEDGSTYNSEDDPRLTMIGKFLRKTSLDETPQILNVIKGDMSLIGPRPDLPGAIFDYNDEAKKKLEVRPGITGYSQAFFRNSISQDEKFLNDAYYVSKLSFTFDLQILVKTIISVIKRKNIYIENVPSTTQKNNNN